MRGLVSTGKQISAHFIAVWHTLRDYYPGWLLVLQIADLAGVSRRTAQNHASYLVEIGVCERAVTFPGGYAYRVCRPMSLAASEYVAKLETTSTIRA